MGTVRIAVIGAGIAGLACAQELARADAKVTVFEKSRGLGGRLGTRRQGDLGFDHGAQYISARSRSFVKYAGVAGRAGVLARWTPRILEDDRLWEAPVEDWFVGQPGMSAVVRPMSRTVDVQSGVGIHEIIQSQRGWELQSDSGRQNHIFDAIAVAVPAPQALTLLGRHGRTFRHLHEVRMAPCWAGMFAFEQSVDLGADVRRWTQGPLTWAACDSTKPNRPAGLHCWVVHASVAWSRQHLEADSVEVAQLLLREFAVATDARLPAPVYAQAHRWRHAFVEEPLGLPCLVDEEIAAGACGDWCIAPRVEAAFESGRALAHSLVSIVGLSLPSVTR
jgi:predicted NAD/FAD-dependent oxidoreductase